jgi:hypothetical protein
MIEAIRRRIRSVLEHHLLATEITLLIGSRQVGTTTLIRTLLRGLQANGYGQFSSRWTIPWRWVQPRCDLSLCMHCCSRGSLNWAVAQGK